MLTTPLFPTALLLATVLASVLPSALGAPPTADDLVIAFPVDEPHLPLAYASRAWRKVCVFGAHICARRNTFKLCCSQGIRTLIAANFHPSEAMLADGRAHNETWMYYPDDVPLRSLYAGDSRAALMPFLAHKVFGATYKWVLYGDDDTIFFIDTILRLLHDFDEQLPYFITDHFWWIDVPNHPYHPNKGAPRCLPCHYRPPPGTDLSRAPATVPYGCPCTPQRLCELDPEHKVFNKWCDMPKAPAMTYSMHGGAGALISVGMLSNITWDWMHECVTRSYSTGGDAFISICLWDAGYAMSDPGVLFFRPEIQMFDPGPEDRMGVMVRLARAFDNRCDDDCMMQLDWMATIHVRSRMFPTLGDAAWYIQGVSGMYDNFVELRRMREARHALATAERGAGGVLEPTPI